MGRLMSIVGASGVGKTALVHALARAFPFETAFEEHAGRPFQALVSQDRRYALPNQIDYLLLRAGQERGLRSSPRTGLTDGGLDLDYHGFTRLFHRRGLLTDSELDLCSRLYHFLRDSLPPPELFVRLYADEATVTERLSRRERINIAGAADYAVFNASLDEWLATLPPDRVLQIDVTRETPDYRRTVSAVLDHIARITA